MKLALYLGTTYAALACRVADGSYGDMEPGFQRCVKGCLDGDGAACIEEEPSWLSSFVSRTCAERCEYLCMSSITAERIRRNLPVYKYYGHWSFYRYGGLEEPASVVFSLANALPHIWHLAGSSRRSSSKKYFMRNHLSFYPYVALTAWFSSAVFHAKKTRRSTWIDYSAALVFLAYGLWLTLRRVAGASKSWPVFTVNIVGSCFGIWLLVRLRDMQRDLVSFDKHMHACIAIAVCTICLWLFWLVLGGDKGSNDKKKLPYPFNRFRCLICQISFAAASMLELFDFPPYWGILDAHSLWHLATVPLGFQWYEFWRQDEINQNRE
jgi:hypothetical protein